MLVLKGASYGHDAMMKYICKSGRYDIFNLSRSDHVQKCASQLI